MAQPKVIQRPRRWDNPFDPDMSEADVDRILGLKLFAGMDADKFPASAPLRDIVRNDMRLLTYAAGDIIVREGDYGTSAYLIVSGNLIVVLPPGLPDTALGRAEVPRKGMLQAFLQLWTNPKGSEIRDPAAVAREEEAANRHYKYAQDRVTLRSYDSVLSDQNIHRIGPGELFGEIAALTRSARTTTVLADGPAELLEIRRQGIRDIRRYVEDFRDQVDKLYRSNTLFAQLSQMPQLRHLSDETIKKIAQKTLFEAYGDFDWHISYNRMMDLEPGDRLAKEPVIAREGDYPDGLLLVRSGFARVSRRVNNGEQTIEYIGGGSLFGFEEIAHNWKCADTDTVGLQHSLRAIGYTDILRIPTSIVEELVLPTIPAHLAPGPIEPRQVHRVAEMEPRKSPWRQSTAGAALDAGLLEGIVEYRYINGTAAMVIDMDRCIRCDACVDACAKGHNNNPRFARHGRVFDHFMIANACMHCVDPVCMIGCPTGAIHRDRRSGQVVINDATCIGCMTCANNCPYDNIRMVEIRDGTGAFIRDQTTNTTIVKATKCDLCIDQPGGPACQRACPHDALRRMPMADFPALADWLSQQ